MVNQTNNNIVRQIDKLEPHETLAVVNYISQLLSKRISRQQRENPQNDDLIGSLADAYENKRARQVIEWERTRRQNGWRAA
jgi:ribosomal protein L18